jgi:hypothetical protein
MAGPAEKVPIAAAMTGETISRSYDKAGNRPGVNVISPNTAPPQ